MHGTNYIHSGGEVIIAKRIEIHPNYRNRHAAYYRNKTYSNYGFDYCLVQIEPIDFNRLNRRSTKVTRTVLPTDHIKYSLGLENQEPTVQDCRVVGWGRQASGLQSAVVLSSEVDIISSEYCVRGTKISDPEQS